MSEFVSLHFHSDFSINDGLSTPDRTAQRLEEISQHSIALSDHGSCAGIAVFNKQLKKKNIKLIPANEMYVAHRGVDDTSARDTSHIVLLASDKEGYHNLIKLHSLSWQRPAYYFNPRTDFDLLYKYNKGIIALSACLGGILLKPYLAGDAKQAELNLVQLAQIFPGRFYIELQDHKIEEDQRCIAWLRSMAKKHKLPLVATCDAHYVYKTDWKAHDRIIACGTGTRVNDPNRAKLYQPAEFHLKSYDEMAERFEPAVLKQSVRIADMCEPLNLESKTFHIPTYFPRPNGLMKKLGYASL